MKSLWNYLRGLTQAESNDSSKRFLAMYVTLILITFIVVMYTDKKNFELILGELLAFVLAMAGVGAWEKRNKSKYNETTKRE